MFENSISLENGQTLGHKLNGLSHNLFVKNFVPPILQTRSLHPQTRFVQSSNTKPGTLTKSR